MTAGQTAADMDRVKELEKVCPLQYVEMEPGITSFVLVDLIHKAASSNGSKIEDTRHFIAIFTKY